MTPHELITEWEALNIEPKHPDTESHLTDETPAAYIAVALGGYTYIIDQIRS